jgi:hypothetical protein
MYIDLLISHAQDLSYKMSSLIEHCLLPGHLTATNGLLSPGVIDRQLLHRVLADKVRATVAYPPYRYTASTAERNDHCGLWTVSLAASERKVKYCLVGCGDCRMYCIG